MRALRICWPLLAIAVSAFADDGRAVGVRAAGSVATLPEASKRWALVVGVDVYQDEQIGRLTGAQNDAKALRDTLVQYAGFPDDQVILLSTNEVADRQPTRLNLYQRLSNLSSIIPKDGLFLFAFSGHGVERQGRAFLLPSDARMSDDIDFLEQSAVSVDWVKQKIKSSGVGQVLVMLDACRNDPGGRADAPNPMTEAYTRGFDFGTQNKDVSAFAILYATAVGQRAYEFAEKRQGYFSWAITEGLRGGAADEQGNVTLTRLIRFVQEKVPKRVAIDYGGGREQKPFAIVEGYRADDLVLAVAVAKPASQQGASPSDERAVEVELWKSVDVSDSKQLLAYLRRFPDGFYSEVAQAKLERLKSTPAEAEVQPSNGGAVQSGFHADYWVDPGTHLVWTVMDNGEDITWESASRYCQSLTLGDFFGWRLPTIDEIDAIVDSSVKPMSFKKPLRFSGFEQWSSTRNGKTKDASFIWLLYLPEKQRISLPSGYFYGRVHCVRESD